MHAGSSPVKLSLSLSYHGPHLTHGLLSSGLQAREHMTRYFPKLGFSILVCLLDQA